MNNPVNPYLNPMAAVGGSLWNPQTFMPYSGGMPTSNDLAGLTTAFGTNPVSGGSGWDASALGNLGNTQTNLPNAGGNGLLGWLRNGENLSALSQGIGALSSAFLGRRQLGIARDNLNFQRDAFERNFANQTQSYNTNLEDRIRGRTANYDGKEADVQAYLARHSLNG